jgi:hypothetical protein
VAGGHRGEGDTSRADLASGSELTRRCVQRNREIRERIGILSEYIRRYMDGFRRNWPYRSVYGDQKKVANKVFREFRVFVEKLFPELMELYPIYGASILDGIILMRNTETALEFARVWRTVSHRHYDTEPQPIMAPPSRPRQPRDQQAQQAGQGVPAAQAADASVAHGGVAHSVGGMGAQEGGGVAHSAGPMGGMGAIPVLNHGAAPYVPPQNYGNMTYQQEPIPAVPHAPAPNATVRRIQKPTFHYQPRR